MHEKLLQRFPRPVPRYTSYPTAPHFHAGVEAGTYRAWLREIPKGAALSLYVHIPYCDRLCWFCACHTKQTRSYEPVKKYLVALRQEIAAVAAAIPSGVTAQALHFGGGSPTLLAPADMAGLGQALRAAFSFSPQAEISVEIDPNDMTQDKLDGLAAIGMTRASLGVQDFDPGVQKAINREQSFECTRWVVEAVRARGAGSVNLDMLYGLPHQTMATLADTVDKVLSLSPDRIALFGYAHVPWFKKHQTMIDEAWLPDARARLELATAATAAIRAAGYVQVGLDHFAKPGDSLAQAQAQGRLHRNFQGYTVDGADVLIGLGASSVGQLPQGYVQNMTATGQYERMAAQGGLAVVKGVALRQDDRARAWIIERLMCDFRFSRRELAARFGGEAGPLLQDAERLAAHELADVLESREDAFVVADHARLHVRSVAAYFDSYLQSGATRHSAPV